MGEIGITVVTVVSATGGRRVIPIKEHHIAPNILCKSRIVYILLTLESLKKRLPRIHTHGYFSKN